MEAKISFSNVNHKYSKQIKLNEQFEAIETPVGFKSIQLYPHQAVVVKGLLDAEEKRIIKIHNINNIDVRRKVGEYIIDDVILETSALVLSEPFGTGKTIIVLALILERPIPKAFPLHINSPSIRMDGPVRKFPVRERFLFKNEVIRKFIGSNALIRPALIIVGSSVLIQWEDTIRDYTNLKVFKVDNYYKLQKFDQMYKNKMVNAYDIILLKNGMVTGNFSAQGSLNAKEYLSLISIMSEITQESCWSRVIYDDFDTISIPAGSCVINALFTTYVSATTKQPSIRIDQKTVEYKNIKTALRKSSSPLDCVIDDKVLFTNFNIRNSNDFVEASTRITKINGYRYVYNNPDDNYIRLIGAMKDHDANIMEMLNGDAIGTAAEALGIKTSSVADIFQRMLDKKYEKYMQDQYVLDTIEQVRNNIFPIPKPYEAPDHTDDELDAIRAAIVKKTVPKIKYNTIRLEKLLDEMFTDFQRAKDIDGLAINRVIDNIKEGMCQICALPLTDFDTFIVRCCGLIVCDICGIKGNQIQKRYDYETNQQTIYGACANCKAAIYPQTDLIFVDRKFDMEALLKAKGDEKSEAPLVKPVDENDVCDNESQIRNPKLKALLAIIQGITPENCEEIPIKINGLLTGRNDIMPDKNAERKVLVFANFNETLNLIEEFLVAQNIAFLRLGGTANEKAATVKNFKLFGNVLLINSQQHCAGINLEFCSDIVFMHKIMDPNIESQVAGRGQRIGRTSNLRIHYICYNNEKTTFK